MGAIQKSFKEHQPPLSIEEQLENLKNKGLIIEDEEKAANFLNDVSYFRLIKAYSLGLKIKNGDYFEGVSFDTLVQLYLFNANFRQVLFPQIEIVEINLRCRIANYFSSKYGIFGYENSENFLNSKYHEAFLNDIQSEINHNLNAPFVKNFLETYRESKLPFYALVELFSFGTLSKFFKNMKNEDKKAIATSYSLGYTYLESWIESIAFVRNICAHYGRLYNAKLAKTPQLYAQYVEEGVGNIRVYAVLLCLKHIIPNDRHWINFVNTIAHLFEKYPAVDKTKMGFPDNWDYLLTHEIERKPKNRR